MKEITRIHLAQTPFNIELNAKKELEKYLAAIEKTLSADDDTLREIEARIVELLDERGVSGEKVITTDDIEAIREQLGAPAEFVDEQEAEVGGDEAGKRLMRDREKGMLGGVLAGIGAYTGIDPIWLRLAAIVLAFASFGTAILVYVVLWVVVPPAKTAADRLQMAGKPVTLGALKEQSQVVVSEVSEKAKPFVVVLRILLGLGFVFGGLGALALVVVAGVTAGVRMTPELFSLVDAWLVVAFALAVVSGLLLAILCGLLAYASFTWRFSRRMAVSTVTIVIAGLVAFSGFVGLGVYGGRITQQNLASITRTEKVQLSELAGAKKLVTKNEQVPVEYRVAQGQPYAEMKVVSKNVKHPQWHISRAGDSATFSIKNINSPDCHDLAWHDTCLDSVSVVIYGPALESLESQTGQLTYSPTSQPALAVTTHTGTNITLSGGVIDTLHANLADDSALAADATAITTSDVNVGRDSSATFGVLSQLTLATPNSCAAASQANVAIHRVTYLKKADFLSQQSEIRENCTTITIDEPAYGVIN